MLSIKVLHNFMGVRGGQVGQWSPEDGLDFWRNALNFLGSVLEFPSYLIAKKLKKFPKIENYFRKIYKIENFDRKIEKNEIPSFQFYVATLLQKKRIKSTVCRGDRG